MMRANHSRITKETARRLKVLALAPYPEEAASTRFRIAQFVPLLDELGITCELKPFIDAALFKRLYRKDRLARNALGIAWAAMKRGVDLLSVSDYDVVFVQREAALIGPPLVERAINGWFKKPLVLDLDDPLWVQYTSPVYGHVASRLRCLDKTSELIRRAAHIVCGNTFIAEYVRDAGATATVLPTIVDTDTFSPRQNESDSEPPTIGWIGTHTTLPYLEAIAPTLEQLAARRRFKLKVVGGARSLNLRGVEVEELAWSLDREVEGFRSLDIGLYPLADDEWSRGKSGFKAIQYLCCGVPFVASPVGVVRDIAIESGAALLASSNAEWLAALDRLLADAILRRSMGRAGRSFALSRYCLAAQAAQLGEILFAAAAQRRTADAVAVHGYNR
ncbi:MAG: glycosyltransferase family 4 protein [Blastocatellia bacterium]